MGFAERMPPLCHCVRREPRFGVVVPSNNAQVGHNLLSGDTIVSQTAAHHVAKKAASSAVITSTV